MASSRELPFFACGNCGRRYHRRSELAGRKVKCRCGTLMVCPAEAPEVGQDEHYALSPSQRVAANTTTPVLPRAPVHARAPTTLGYRPRGVAAAGEDDPFPDRTIDLHLPLVLLASGAIVHIGAALVRMYGCCDPLTVFLRTLRSVGIMLILGPAVMMAGLFIAAHFRGIKFGNVYVAAMKLAAIAIAPGAAGVLVAPIAALIPLFGWLGVLLVEFALYFALIGAMFKLDESDTWYCVCVFFVLSVATYFALRALPWAL